MELKNGGNFVTSGGSVGLVLLGFIFLSFILMVMFKKVAPHFKATLTLFLNALLSYAIVFLPGIGYILFLFWILGIVFAGLGVAALIIEIIIFARLKKK